MKKSFLHVIAIFLFNSLSAQNVYTPKGTLVPTYSYFTYSYSQAQLDAFQDDVENGVYGSSCVVGSNSDNDYNCHGYAWNMYPLRGREVGLDDYSYNAVSTYINDGSYLTTQSTTLPGVIVRYTGDHSAVVVNITNRFFSKWGAGPVVRHAPGDVPPAYSSPYAYYRCNFSSYLTSAQMDNGPISYGSSPSFQATTGSHRIDVEGNPHTIYSFSTPPGIPGISIYGQFANTVLFDKPAYGQQGRHIAIALSK